MPENETRILTHKTRNRQQLEALPRAMMFDLFQETLTQSEPQPSILICDLTRASQPSCYTKSLVFEQNAHSVFNFNGSGVAKGFWPEFNFLWAHFFVFLPFWISASCGFCIGDREIVKTVLGCYFRHVFAFSDPDNIR